MPRTEYKIWNVYLRSYIQTSTLLFYESGREHIWIPSNLNQVLKKDRSVPIPADQQEVTLFRFLDSEDWMSNVLSVNSVARWRIA